MKPLNAVDAITPAFERTKLVLFSPFRFGRTWKLSVTGYLAFAGMFFFPLPLIGFAFLPELHRSARSGAVPLLLCAIVFGTAFFLAFFYLCVRLQFSFLDIVVNRGEFVAPAWRKYGRQTGQWVGLMGGLGTICTLAMMPAGATYFRHLFSMIDRMKSLTPGQPPPADFLVGFYAGYFLFYALMLVAVILCSTMAAFLVPSLALEQVSLPEAFRRFGLFIRREPGQFLGFVAMRALLGVGGYIAQFICFEVLFILQFLIIGLIAVLVGLALHLVGVPTTLLIVLGVVLALTLYLFNIVYVALGSFGILVTFMQAHTLYFLGGRYALLGELLERSTPQPAYPLPYGYPPQGIPMAAPTTAVSPEAPPSPPELPPQS